MTKVVNKFKEPFDVYIGRPSIFGNTFEIGVDGDRNLVIGKFTAYFYDCIGTNENFRKSVEKLKGKTLGCYCSPKPCHGDVIARYLDND